MEIRILLDKSEKIEFVRRCVTASFSINIVYFRTLLGETGKINRSSGAPLTFRGYEERNKRTS